MQKPEGEYIRDMRVGHIREKPSSDYAEVIFLESSRFYRLEKRNPDFDTLMKLLRNALEKNQVIKVHFSSVESDIIQGISK